MDDEYVEAVLCLVEQIPPGRVSTYGRLAAAVGAGGPRQVGTVMRLHGGSVPWWRVVRADGSLPASHAADALAKYRAEGTPIRDDGGIDLRRALWEPDGTPPCPGRRTPLPGGSDPGR